MSELVVNNDSDEDTLSLVVADAVKESELLVVKLVVKLSDVVGNACVIDDTTIVIKDVTLPPSSSAAIVVEPGTSVLLAVVVPSVNVDVKLVVDATPSVEVPCSLEALDVGGTIVTTVVKDSPYPVYNCLHFSFGSVVDVGPEIVYG